MDQDHGAMGCDGCGGWVHYLCSGLPVYQLILMAGSSRKYLCSACVNVRFSDYKVRNDSIQSLIDIQRDEFSAEANTSRESVIGDTVADITSTPRKERNTRVIDNGRINDESGKGGEKSQKVCRFYLQSKCKHGRKGDGCKFPHPKICKRFARDGSGAKGCAEEECKFFHPLLCRNSEKERRCGRENCRFFHLSGTARSDLEKGRTAAKEAPRKNKNKDMVDRFQNRDSKTALPVADKNINDDKRSFLKELHAIKEAIRELQMQQAIRLSFLPSGNHGMHMQQMPMQHMWQGPGGAPLMNHR